MFRLVWGLAGSAVLVLASTACTTVANEDRPDPASSLDEAVFRCKVEPILARQCSFNACHGNADSPLRVYTPGKLRAAATVDIDALRAPLTDAEHHANFESAAGFSFAADRDHNLLVLKPLPPDDGGFAHRGGVIWTGSDDPQAAAIYAWLGGGGRCP